MSSRTDLANTGLNNRRRLTVALAGNANVGKSVIFNQLTGLHQHVGNWPGKTVKRAEGTLSFGGYTIDVVDLPGIYSLSTYSLEEKVSREFIAVEHPDAIINVVDASALERNLFFTAQLLEIEPHLIVALNQMDLAEKKGIKVDVAALSRLLGVPVVPTIATKNEGLQELMVEVVRIHEEDAPTSKSLGFGSEIIAILNELIAFLKRVDTSYPRFWVAVKLLEGDEELETLVYSKKPEMRQRVDAARKRIEDIHGHTVSSVIASERYAQASRLAAEVTTYFEPRSSVWKSLGEVTDHPIYGYVIMIAVIVGMFFTIFTFGDAASRLLGYVFEQVKSGYYTIFGNGTMQSFLWNGIIEGIIAGTSIALPYIVPVFLVLSLLEDSGYLPRVAFLMDSAHAQDRAPREGLHTDDAWVRVQRSRLPGLQHHGDREGEADMRLRREPCSLRREEHSDNGFGRNVPRLQLGSSVVRLGLPLIFVLGRIAFKVYQVSRLDSSWRCRAIRYRQRRSQGRGRGSGSRTSLSRPSPS